MPRFDVVIRVGPARLFGLPDPEGQALPGGTAPTIKWERDLSRVWVEMPDGSDPYRKDEERFTLDEKIGDATVVAEDDLFRVTLPAADEDDASSRAAELVLAIFHLGATIFRPGVHRITATVIAVVSGLESEDEAEYRLAGLVSGVYLYDLGSLRTTLSEAIGLLSTAVGDARLKQALRYFGLGDDLSHLLARSTVDDYGTSLAPIRFLQYWKALCTIVGDPSADKDYQSRPKDLGLGRPFFRNVVQPLHDIRNKFGVAHIADPDAPQIVTDANVAGCRDAAATAIQAYIKKLGKVQSMPLGRRAILREGATQ